MIDNFCLPLLEAKSREELGASFRRFANHLGFDLFGGTVVIDQPESEPQFQSVHNAPDAYLNEYSAGGRHDPVMQHCKRNSFPIVWDQTTYVTAGVPEKWDLQSAFGYRTGVCTALHLPQGLHFIFGVNRDQQLLPCAAEASAIAAELQLFAVYAQDVATRLLVDRRPEEGLPVDLSSRELECLRWTRDGKTAWEVGRILGISEQTAARHLHNASRKLSCGSKHQAVLKAMRFSLIS